MGLNPKLFREMSQPHESREAMNKAHEDFFDELGELRKKHKIANVVVIMEDSYENDGEELGMIGASSYGDPLKAESLCGYGYGLYKREKEEMLAKLLKGA